MKTSIENWTENDITVIAEIERQCIKKPWTEKMLVEEYANPYFNCVVARFGSELAGYINYHKIGQEYHIANIAVKENFRRKGIASMLIIEIISRAQNNNINGITLEAGESNFTAISLYKKMGFKAEGKRKNYYGNESALIMWIYL